MLLYGPPKVGKSTFCSKFEDPLFLSTEPGLKFLRVRKVDIKCWADFTTVVEKLEKDYLNGKVTLSVVVIDTVDNLGKFCMKHVCRARNIDHPADQEWGKGWEAFFDEWHRWIVRLCQIGFGVVFIGHSTEKEVTYRSMKITKTMPAMPTTVYRSINAMVDFILFAGFKEVKVKTKDEEKPRKILKRVLYTKPTESMDAGDRSGALPPTMEFDFDTFQHYLTAESPDEE